MHLIKRDIQVTSSFFIFSTLLTFIIGCSSGGFSGSTGSRSSPKQPVSTPNVVTETKETPVNVTPAPIENTVAPIVHLVSSADMQVANAYAGESCDSKCTAIDSVCIAAFLLDGQWEHPGGGITLRGFQGCSTVGKDVNGGYYGACICLKASTDSGNSATKAVDILSADFKTITGSTIGENCNSVCSGAQSTCLAGFLYNPNFLGPQQDVVQNIQSCADSPQLYPSCMCLSETASNATSSQNTVMQSKALTAANFATTQAKTGSSCDTACLALNGKCMSAFLEDFYFGEGHNATRRASECSTVIEGSSTQMDCICFIK